jgi:hypothetical protein
MIHSTSPASEEAVRAIAYKLWLEEGCPEGRAEHHWFKANELMSGKTVAASASAAKPKRKHAVKKAKSA